MSLYADYIKEREDYEIIENDFGFANYNFDGGCCYIRDVYVKPDARHAGEASSFVDLIAERAKAKGIKTLLTSVCTKANNVESSLQVILKYGFKFESIDDTMLYFSKEI